MEILGNVAKLKSQIDDKNRVLYELPMGDLFVPLNPLLGQRVRLEYLGSIHCAHCNRKIKKSFNNGYCFPCVKSLASCDICIVKPELCHYFKGTCRQPSWGESNCMINHTVYLANSSGLKVGITRSHQRLTRWIDQGASAAIPLLTVNNRLEAGRLEVEISKKLADKTNWRKMLSGPASFIDLNEAKSKVVEDLSKQLAWNATNEAETQIFYPVLEYPKKIQSLNLDKTPKIDARLLGIKGQYLIFDTGVINIRKYTGYALKIATI